MISKWLKEIIIKFKEDNILDLQRLKYIDKLLRAAMNSIDDENLYDKIRKEINGTD